MTNLIRHLLNFEKAIKYVKKKLTNINKLSVYLTDLIDFKLGEFYTLLPEDANLEDINKFHSGGICHSVINEINSIVINKLHQNNQMSCIFDDVTATYHAGYKDSLFSSCGLFYENEVYYLVTQTKASTDLVDACFYASNATWHSLCVLTEIDISNVIDQKITLEKIQQICLNAKLIIIGAYDGEGYIFWEKTSP